MTRMRISTALITRVQALKNPRSGARLFQGQRFVKVDRTVSVRKGFLLDQMQDAFDGFLDADFCGVEDVRVVSRAQR